MICQAPIALGQLNAFQKVMLQWSELHPYNATHTYKLAGPARKDDLARAVAGTFRMHSMGVSHLSANGQSYQHETGDEPEVAFCSGGSTPEIALAEQLTRAINQPFERPTCQPLRFSILDAGPQAHYVTLAYDHWIADSQAARLILRSVLGRYLRLPILENEKPLDLYPPTYREVFGRRLHGLRLVTSALRAMRQWNRNRKAWQVACWSNANWAVCHRLYHTIPGTVPRLREFARSLGATVHDVFLAAMGRALAEVMPARGKNRGQALGTIVDTRSLAEDDLSQSLGAFLGYYLVRSHAEKSLGLAETVRQIAAVTRPVKERQLYFDSLVNMKLFNWLWPRVPVSVQPHFLRNTLRVTGGISNVVVHEPWIKNHHGVILDYSRGVATGPVVPLVLTPTTLGEQLNVGVNYRLTGFSQAKIDAVMSRFLDEIEHLGAAGRVGKTRSKPAAAGAPIVALPAMAKTVRELAVR